MSHQNAFFGPRSDPGRSVLLSSVTFPVHIYIYAVSLLREPRLLAETRDARFVAASMAINIIEVSRNLEV